MPSPIISVENLGKRYTLRHQGGNGAGYRRFSEELVDLVKRPFRRLFSARRPWVNGARGEGQGASADGDGSPLQPGDGQGVREDFWALKGVSFEVQQGDVLGIIGRNGAGKSTLLKVLSRITEPSEGRVRLRGRVASLLEVGTGFHPELTGRENVYLNGAVLGMSRAEIRRKFDEIVAFAEVEKFLDTPVKHYSSGMYVRLAFAVAAHLEPEILIVDEVLAVGDVEFQKKCLGKMKQVANGGRTVLFVSHNLNAVVSLCNMALTLTEGVAGAVVSAEAAVSEYLARIRSVTEFGCLGVRLQGGGSSLVLSGMELQTRNGDSSIRVGDSLDIILQIRDHQDCLGLECGIVICDEYGQRIAALQSAYNSAMEIPPSAATEVICHIPSVPLVPGRYFVDVIFALDGGIVGTADRVLSFDVLFSDVFGTGRTPSKGQGYLVLPAGWTAHS